MSPKGDSPLVIFLMALSNFYTQNIRNDPRVNSPERCSDLALLEPNMRRKVIAIVSDAARHGVNFIVFETYRSPARQQQLYDQGATRLRHVGTHGYGLAADLTRVAGGQPSWDGDFHLLGHLAHVHGLITGLDWGFPNRPHSFVDAVHVQRCSVADQGKLFAGLWYPDSTYDPYLHL